MRTILTIILLAFTINATETSRRIDVLLQQQDSIFREQHRGIQTLWRSNKDLFSKIEKRELSKRIIEMPVPPPPPPPPSDTATHVVHSAVTYGYEVTERLITLSERTAVLETNMDRILKVVEGTQKMNIDNRDFIIDLVNSILLFLGSGGGLSLLITLYLKTRKKKI